AAVELEAGRSYQDLRYVQRPDAYVALFRPPSFSAIRSYDCALRRRFGYSRELSAVLKSTENGDRENPHLDVTDINSKFDNSLDFADEESSLRRAHRSHSSAAALHQI
ncbi:hypothetical protein ACQR1I_17970, partial [Bradyrhizobium sp. HKCCYLS2038]|uniref:hypothetical protein n=1 Tax=Bradyrhizobium sp. HKCCYLS2038 TaxID=3420764 RepID=UPI003EBA7E3A